MARQWTNRSLFWLLIYGLFEALLVSGLLGGAWILVRPASSSPAWLGFLAFALPFLIVAFLFIPVVLLIDRRLLRPMRRIAQGDLALAEGRSATLNDVQGTQVDDELLQMARSREAVLRRLRLMEAIGDLSIRQVSPEGLQIGILAALLEALDCERGRLWLLDAEGSMFVGQVELERGGRGVDSFPGHSLAASGEPLLEAMNRQKGPVVIPDTSDPQYQSLIGSQALGTGGFRSLIGLPMLREGDLIGFLVLGDVSRVRPFTVADVALGREAVGLASIALNNARAHFVEQEQGKRIIALAELAATLTTHHSLGEVLQAIVRRGAELGRSATCSVLLVDEERRELVLWAQVGLDSTPNLRLPLSLEVVGSFLNRGEPLIVEDVDRDLPALRTALVRKDVRSISILPLKIGNRVIGAMTLGRLHAYLPSAAERSVSEALSGVAAAAIQNARAFEGEVEQRNLLATVAEISRRVSGILDTDHMLREVCSLIRDALGFDHVHVFLQSPTGEQLAYAAGSGEVGHAIAARGFELPIDSKTFVGRVAELGEALNENEVVHDRFHHADPALANVKSESGLPIITHDDVIGVLNVQSTRPRAFDSQVEQLLRVVAEQVAVALDNAHHHAEVEHQARLDSLTQVLNHGAFVARLHELVESCRGDETPLSLIMLDVDNFKAYNDRFGHVAGDAALRTTVRAIRAHVKKRDAIGRWGGEEFGIALVGATKEQARQVADRIQGTLASLKPVDDLGRQMPAPTVSQGIATLDEDAGAADELVDEADRALYEAKDAGRNQVRIAGVA